jgi:integrase/transcriptional regulator with XRE-family HTH domain
MSAFMNQQIDTINTTTSQPRSRILDSADTGFAITYGELKKSHAEQLQREGTGDQQVRNRLTGINTWMRMLDVTDESTVGPEMAGEFDRELLRMHDYMSGQELSDRTKRDRIEFMLLWRRSYNEARLNDPLPSNFGAALSELMRRKRMDVFAVSRASGIHTDTLNSWIQGRYVPRVDVLTRIAQLERALGVPHEALLGRLGMRKHVWYARLRKEDRNTHRATSFGKQLSDHYKDRGKYIIAPTDRLQAQWKGLTRYMTSPNRPNVMARNVWRLRQRDNVGSKLGWAAAIDGLICPTADAWWNFLSCYLSWMIRPSQEDGGGISTDSVDTLAWAIDDVNVLGYALWRQRRSRNIAHNGIKVFLARITTLLRPEAGWLWRNPAIAATLPESVRSRLGIDMSSPEALSTSWRLACERTTAECDRHWKAVGPTTGNPVRQSRDAAERLAPILSTERPLEVLLRMTRDHENNPPPKSDKRDYPTWTRDTVLLRMMVSNPLRIGQMAMIRYRTDNTGNLYQNAQGEWWLRFNPEDFKNEKGAAHSHYNVRVHPSVAPWISRYLAEGRPYLKDAALCDYFFRPWDTGRARRDTDHLGMKKVLPEFLWDGGGMSIRIRELVLRHLPGVSPFSAHAFRHIVATDFLKRFPGAYLMVATLLHDKLATVIAEYSHVNSDDALKKLSGVIDDYFEAQLPIASPDAVQRQREASSLRPGPTSSAA